MNPLAECLWRSAFKVIYGWIYGIKIYGREHFPKEGAVIVASNHISNNDPPICGLALPRHVSFMAKEELFRNPILRTIITWLGAFPVRRGGVDKIAIRHAMGILKEGRVLGIFPEGTRQRSGKLGRFHDGVASMALRTGVPVVPMALIGSDRLQRGRLAAIIGEPMVVEKGKPTEEAIHGVNEELRARIQGMIDDYHAGKYKGE